jgi:hypothetical protein
MEASQNKSDATNRFGDRDFILAVCTCFIRKCGHFEVIRDFPSFKHGGIPFRSMQASQNKSDVTIHFLVRGLVIHFAGLSPSIWFRSKVIQEFHVCALVQNVSQFSGANMTPKVSSLIWRPPKGTSLRKSASIEALWSRWLFPFGL